MSASWDLPPSADTESLQEAGLSDLARSPFSLPTVVRGKEVRVAWVGRTSTEDNQDPRQSLLRQIDRCKSALPEPWAIVAHFYDVESGRMELERRGRKTDYDRFDIPIARDGGISALLAEAAQPSRRFDVVICESMSRIARKMYETLSVERELERAGVAVFASNEPISLSGGRSQQILQRRINQSVAEYEVLNMLEQSWGGTCTHVREGFNIGKPPYGYKAKTFRHPNQAKAEKGGTKTRLEPDDERARTVTLIAKWRYHEQLGFDAIAQRLNTDLNEHPPPEANGGQRTRSAWSKSSVADILKNPKYTGYQVYNRRARRSRGGTGVHNSPEMWVWSHEPAHEPLFPKWMFDELQKMRRSRQGSRDGTGRKNDPRAKRTYLLRRRVLCDCGRRMIGNVRHGRTYYRCHPETNNQGRPDRYVGHPATIYMREDLILDVVNRFFAERVFGPDRARCYLDGIDTHADRKRQERHRTRTTLNTRLTELARKQDNLLRQAEDADPADPFIQGLKSRFNELDAEGDTVRERIAELDQQDRYDHAPEPSQVELLEALPKLQVNLHHAPPQLLGRLFDLVQLTIRVHYATDEATVSMRLPGDEVLGLQALSEDLNQDCAKAAGRSQCATCTCPRSDSNGHCTDFESAASAGWATGA